jgi:hypothetical protein
MKIESSVVNSLSSPRPYLFAALQPRCYQFARLASKTKKSFRDCVPNRSRDRRAAFYVKFNCSARWRE